MNGSADIKQYKIKWKTVPITVISESNLRRGSTKYKLIRLRTSQERDSEVRSRVSSTEFHFECPRCGRRQHYTAHRQAKGELRGSEAQPLYHSFFFSTTQNTRELRYFGSFLHLLLDVSIISCNRETMACCDRCMCMCEEWGASHTRSLAPAASHRPG